MEKIEHSYLNIRGLNLHIAHIGKGELGTVLFLHGFPEIWYSWRHQMIAVAEAGFRAIAPDCRGYGLSEQPPEPEKATWKDLVDDLLAILDSLSIPKVFVVGKDFGYKPAYEFAVYHPDRVAGVVTLGIPFTPKRTPSFDTLPEGSPKRTPSFDTLPEGFYIFRWSRPGRAEADFGRFEVKRVVRTIYILFSRSEIPIAAEGQEIMDLADSTTPLPPWFTDEDLAVYASLYEKSGFTFPLQMPYRSWNRALDEADPKVEVPALLVMGEKDYVLKFPGMEEYVRSGMVKNFVPDLEIIYMPEGGHFVQEQFPSEVNQHIIKFLKSHI